MYSIDALAYLDDDLDYYSNGICFLKIKVKGLNFNIEIEIESAKLELNIPDFLKSELNFKT